MAKTYKVSTVEVSAQSRKEWLARKRGKGEVATSAAAVVVLSEDSSAPSALDALFRQVNIGTDDAPKYVAEALFPLRIGDALLDWHADQKYLGVEHATESEKANFFATGGVTAGGIGSSSGGSGGGGSTTLSGLNDVALKSAIANDMLVYNGTHWVNTPMSAIKPDLTAYATKSWVEGKGYITASALDPYAKTADVANTYATKTALQGVDIRVQAIEYIFEKDNDGVINKWSEIVDFLAGVEGTTLDSILDQFATKDSLSGYLPLSGGEVYGDVSFTGSTFTIKRGGNATIKLSPNNMNFWLGVNTEGRLFVTNNGYTATFYILHTGNLSAYTFSYLKSNDVNVSDVYDLSIHSGNFLGRPSNAAYGVLMTLPYRQANGNSTPDFGAQLFFPNGDDKSSNIYWRDALKAEWKDWRVILDSSNYTEYTVSKTGGTFSGDITIGVSGQAGTNSSLLNIDAIANVIDHPLGSLYGKMFSIGVKGKYGTHIWAQGDGNGFIQVGRSDGRAEAYHLCLQHLGGNVGIGTTNPTSKLHVVGGARITDSTTIEKNLFVDKNIYIAESSSNGGIYFGDDEYAYIKETPDDVMTIASNQGLILKVNHISDEGAVIRMEGPVRIGDAILSWDSTNKCITIKNVNTGQKASLLVDGGVTATAIS